MASAVRTIRGSDAGEQAERNDQAEHADIEGHRPLDQEVGLIGPESAQGREPSGIEEPAVLGDRSGRARLGDGLAEDALAPRSGRPSLSQRAAGSAAVEQPRPAGPPTAGRRRPRAFE